MVPMVIAHRAGNKPSTVAPALRRADGVECDVHLNRGRVEVRHEKVLRPTSLLWERWYFLPRGTTAPPIDSILDQVPSDVPIMLDLKCFTRQAARRIRRMVPEDRPLLVSCRSWWVLSAFRDRPRTVLLRSCGNQAQIRAVTLVPGLGDRVGVVAHNRLLDRQTIEALRRRTPVVFTWAVDNLERGRRLVDDGVVGLIVDDLDIAWADLRVADNGVIPLS